VDALTLVAFLERQSIVLDYLVGHHSFGLPSRALLFSATFAGVSCFPGWFLACRCSPFMPRANWAYAQKVERTNARYVSRCGIRSNAGVGDWGAKMVPYIALVDTLRGQQQRTVLLAVRSTGPLLRVGRLCSIRWGSYSYQ
jgi:hypothetical protein